MMNAPILSRDDPALLTLEAEYEKLNLLPLSLWKTWSGNIDIQRFRGEHAYLAQMWSMDEQRYLNSFDYLIDIGEGEMLARLGEDDAFGCITFQRNGYTFSRDLIDSVLELRFLRETLGLSAESPAFLLDIGAGYGRFAHRFSQAFPGLVFCVDAVPLSTYLCQFYLDFRGGLSPLKLGITIPLDKLGQRWQTSSEIRPSIATNQQSFSEMPLAAVDFWLNLCADLNIRYFMLEPHSGDLVHPHYVTSEPDGSHLNYWHLFERYGYAEIRREYKFPEGRNAEFIFNTQFVMFERRP